MAGEGKSALDVGLALGYMADQLEEGTRSGVNPYFDYNFYDFFYEVFVHSFPDKDFDTWHVRLLIEDVQRAFDEGKNLVFVLPRYHLKSTVLYAAAIWRLCTLKNPKILYLSYKEGMARYHMGEIKTIVRENPILSQLMRDLTARSPTAVRYAIPGVGVSQILSGGILSFKRGLHLDGCLLPDEKVITLRRPYTPLVNIQDIKRGDFVKTHLNRYRRVLATSERSVSEEIVVLEVDKVRSIRVTVEHPLLTVDGWKTAGAIQTGQEMARRGRITNTSREFYEGNVYNLEVEEDNTYVGARGIIYHNCVIADDVLRDPQNPLNLSQLLVVERHIRAEIANIPNKGIPMILAGTPMHQQDILLKLEDDEEYIWRFLPAIDPLPDHDVLWPKQYPKDWLERKAKSDWFAFQTEFMLTPVAEVAAFFTREELAPSLRDDLVNLSLYVPRVPQEDDVAVFGGYDVGKKRHPSHLSVFVRKQDGSIMPIHQSFHDSIDYVEQARRLTLAVENFGIQQLLVDNTRAEMEERGLPSECYLVTMTPKFRKEVATAFSKFVTLRHVELFDDVRYLSQIVSVSSDLQAPETPLGHGEAFWSSGLALCAIERAYGTGPMEIGSLAFLTGGSVAKVGGTLLQPGNCPYCGDPGIAYFRNGQNAWSAKDASDAKCLKCGERFPIGR